MRRLLKVSGMICVLLSLFQTYFTLTEQPQLILQLFLPMLAIGLSIYYGSQFVLNVVVSLQRRPVLQLVLLYTVGVVIGLLMTCLSRGWNLASLFLTLKINVIALPLFLLVLFVWKRDNQQMNQLLQKRQEQLIQEQELSKQSDIVGEE